MTALTSLQIKQLNNMNAAAQHAALGTRLNTLEAGIVYTNVLKYSTTPALGTDVAIKAAYTLDATPTAGVTAGITQPDVCRVLLIKGSTAGITGNVVIHGIDHLGAIVTDTIASNGTGRISGVVAFKTVVSIDFPARNAPGDTISIGTANIIGLPLAVADATFVVVKSFDGAPDAGSVSANAVVSLSKYTPAGTLDGTKVLLLYIMP
jgi:hypothetical protein